MILAPLDPTADEIAELHAAGWSFVMTTGRKLSAVKKGDQSGIVPWDLALSWVRFPQVEEGGEHGIPETPRS